jgi:hypothetical protein
MHVKTTACWVACLVLFLASNAHAMLVYDGTAANLSAPIDDPGWDAVGTIYVGSASNKPASAVFLGNDGGFGWFLTANHVSLSSATLTIGGNTYNVFANQTQIGSVDLKVFRVDTTISNISAVTLAYTVPSVGTSVTMVGYGKTGTKTTWNTSKSPWTSPGGGAEGYTWSDPNVKRWGTNTVYESNATYSSASNLLVTDFDAVAGEAQGSLGDSGGSVFTKNGLNWELAALVINVGVTNGIAYGGSFSGQPESTSVAAIVGQPAAKSVTFSIQIANYRTDILNAIPEPSTIGLAVAGLLAFLGWRCRRA